ncbi:hypothetical protein [Defluviimonas sp. SAOS-178_SWC]|uniref:hypothetical protein n=1 Tax=Defluviimonas sp. SAOS-178_SWC TaxID=3121287 RepID=UPI0032220C61
MRPRKQDAFTDTKAGVVTGSISLRSNGSRLFLLNRKGATCTAVYNNAAVAGSTELSKLVCSDGNNGNATLRYGSDGKPAHVLYNAGLDGGGTVRF